MPDPLFTIVVPTRHRNAELARCLDRLAPGAQALPAERYEVIVTDDGSSRTAEALVRETYPWAKWLAGPQRGPAANRNAGAARASGEFIVFTDDDCLPSPQWLASFAASLQPGVDLYEGKTTCAAGLNPLVEEAPVNLHGGCLWSCNLAVRKSAFAALGGFDEDFPLPWCEDLEFGDRAKSAGYRCQFIAGAAVDHPPRPRPPGRKDGMRWESRVLLWYKQGHVGSPWSWLPVHLAKVRLARILAQPAGWHSAVALGSFASELTHVLAHLSRWERKHRPATVTTSRLKVLGR
ncbi:MAG TPA: glycosyltransferase [Tepidisphaeraceae bacterium]|nr:glycosyltransferase [Tepidisphaeraceae bacterium]